MRLNLKKLSEEFNPSREPQADRANCEQCSWEGWVKDCQQQDGGSWEEGYYKEDCCPECGGPVEYSMTEERGRQWMEWFGQKGH